MTKILSDIGRVQPLDEHGCIINTAHKKRIQMPWRNMIKVIVDALTDKLGSTLHSVYVRGSVANGNAVTNVSDLDLIVFVLKDDIDKKSLSQSFNMQPFLDRYPFCTKVDLNIITEAELLHPNSTCRFFIKTQSCCIYGEDLAVHIPSYKACQETADLLMVDINWAVNKAKLAIASLDDGEVVAQWCTWVMKILLRCGFLQVMVRANCFTRDLYPCYDYFSFYYPEKAIFMYRVLELAINPSTKAAIVNQILDAVGSHFICQRVEP